MACYDVPCLWGHVYSPYSMLMTPRSIRIHMFLTVGQERFMTPDISKHELKVRTVLAIWSCRIVCMLIGISASRTVATVARQNDQNAKLRICPMPRDSLLTKKSLHVDSAHNPFLLCSCCVSQCFTALTLSTRVNSVNCRDCSAPGIRHSARVHGLAF